MAKRNARNAVAVTGVLTVAVVLAGCGGSNRNNADGEVAGQISYSYWGQPARSALVDDVVELFEKRRPAADVRTEVSDYNSYIERLTVRAAGNNLACATATQSTFLTQYARNGTLRPLDDLIESHQINVSAIPENVLASGRVDGKQFMIPTGSFLRLFVYNTDMVGKAGISPPTNDMTWAAYADWLRDLKASLPEGVYAGGDDGGLMFTFASWVYGHGQQVYTKDGLGFEKSVLADYFHYWLRLSREGIVLPPAQIPDQYGVPPEVSPLARGVVASSSQDLPQLRNLENSLRGAGRGNSVGWVSMPSESPKNSANLIGSNGISIADSCDNVPTAAAFIDFFANDPDAARAFRSNNGVLTNTSAQDALLKDPKAPEEVKRGVETLRSLTDAADVASMEYVPGNATLTAQLLRLYQSLAFGEITVDAAVEEFFRSADEALS